MERKKKNQFQKTKRSSWHCFGDVSLQKLFLFLNLITITLFSWEILHFQILHYNPPYQLQNYYLATIFLPKMGIGNELFLYASITGIAADHPFLIPVLPKEAKIHNFFKLNMRTRHSKYLGAYQFFKEDRANTFVNFSKEIVPSFSVYIDCYLQSWKHFIHAEKKIREEFTLKENIVEKAKTELTHIVPSYLSNGSIQVGVHVRRGDMVNSHSIWFGYTVPDASFFQKAMQYFRQRYAKVYFVVCTNDMKWSKANIHGEDVFFSESASYAVDFAILTTSDHVIMSVGSYGWWAAWLANGTTIYYKDWPAPGTPLWDQVQHEDYFLPHWIPM